MTNRSGVPAEPELRGGHGLIGIGERVALFGGTCSSGASGAGAFTTEVDLPLAGSA